VILGAKVFNPPTSEIPFLLFALYNPQNMAGRKRPRTADHGLPPPTLPPPSLAKLPGVQTSTRQAMSSRQTRSTSARGKSAIVPTPTETRPITTSEHHGDDSQGASNTGTSHSSRHTLNHRELAREASKIVNNADSAELAILELMDKYSFSLPRLKELLTGKSITPFSITLSHY
jgi:hypothetical protein